MGDKQSKSIVFVLEEFDLFCEHHNQTLLYDLFDSVQSKTAPILVVGVSARIDVIELMEKRVQSRCVSDHSRSTINPRNSSLLSPGSDAAALT